MITFYAIEDRPDEKVTLIVGYTETPSIRPVTVAGIRPLTKQGEAQAAALCARLNERVGCTLEAI